MSEPATSQAPYQTQPHRFPDLQALVQFLRQQVRVLLPDDYLDLVDDLSLAEVATGQARPEVLKLLSSIAGQRRPRVREEEVEDCRVQLPARLSKRLDKPVENEDRAFRIIQLPGCR